MTEDEMVGWHHQLNGHELVMDREAWHAAVPVAAKNIISLISMLTIWWCACVESSLVMLEEAVCNDQSVFLGKLY